MRILVTGGAGYIGAHVVAALGERGDEVVVIDDLSAGDPERVAGCELVRLPLGGDAAIDGVAEVLARRGIDAVMHFAARKSVAESVQRPAWYASENIGSTANLLQAMERSGVQRLVFSSSAAVYGATEGPAISELDPTEPVNPYGETKLYGERLVAAAAKAQGLAAVSLRYFNVGGAMSPLLADRGADNLIPMVFDRVRRGVPPRIFGDDYDTADGTCVRDFVHVADLADAHVAALDHLATSSAPEHSVFNVGTGRGSSVREVVAAVEATVGRPLRPVVEPRRVGDPAWVVASPERIAAELGWRATRTLEEIVESAWRATAQRS